jgi:hypothetical protein
MNYSTFALICVLIAGCQNRPNQELYDEVMAIHDEVMPKMDDIYKAKAVLKKQLETPGLTESKKKKINNKIAQLDSAGESMMVWMREFDPIPDSLGEEKARQYLKDELVEVKQVRENILHALENAQQAE